MKKLLISFLLFAGAVQVRGQQSGMIAPLPPSATIVQQLNTSPSTKLTPALLPLATNSAAGGVTCDGTTITCLSGVISAVNGGKGGYTAVITAQNTNDVLTYTKPVCVENPTGANSSYVKCDPGGTDIPASTPTYTVSTLSSPPTSDTSATTFSVTTNTTSTQTNVLETDLYGVCNDCTQLINDFWFQTDSNSAHASSYESDMAIFDKTRLLDFMYGLQCNQANHLWQIDNQTVPWVNTTVACSLSANTWYHIIFKAHRVIGDTSCAGGMPCEYFDSLTVNGVVSNLAQTIPATVLNSTWSGAVLDQKQIDIGATTSAQTVSEKITANNLTAYTGSAIAGVTDASGNVGNLASYNFDGTGTTGLTATGTPAIATTNVLSSPQSVHFPTGTNFYTATFGASTTLYTRQYIQVNTVGSTTDEILDLYNGSTELYTLYLSTTNFLSYYNEMSASGGTASGSALPTGSYVYVEMYWTANASTGAVTIKLNGTTVYTATGLNTGTLGATKALFGQAGSSTGWDTNMDNVDISSTGYLGPVTFAPTDTNGIVDPTGTCGTGSTYRNSQGASGHVFWVCVASSWVDVK